MMSRHAERYPTKNAGARMSHSSMTLMSSRRRQCKQR
jgi:hypothetical protein